jgi:hypothetical protein
MGAEEIFFLLAAETMCQYLTGSIISDSGAKEAMPGRKQGFISSGKAWNLKIEGKCARGPKNPVKRTCQNKSEIPGSYRIESVNQ